jgi:hypothetical protein
MSDESRVAALEWSDLEDAVGRRDWVVASRLAQEFEQEWKTVRAFVEIFAGPGAQTWARLMNKAMTGLVEALCARPIDPVAVDGAMSRFRMLMP